MPRKNKDLWKEEDYIWDAENHAARPYYTESGCRALLAAVCLHAIKDYKDAPTKKSKDAIKPFFSDWMFQYMLGDMEPDEIIKALDKMPNKIAYVAIIPGGGKQYITHEAKHNRNAPYKVMKDGKFVAGYKTLKSARRIADELDAAIFENGKEIYSKTLHLKG